MIKAKLKKKHQAKTKKILTTQITDKRIVSRMAMEGDLTWGSEHTMQCTDDVLWNCAPETCIILLTGATQ